MKYSALFINWIKRNSDKAYTSIVTLNFFGEYRIILTTLFGISIKVYVLVDEVACLPLSIQRNPLVAGVTFTYVELLSTYL